MKRIFIATLLNKDLQEEILQWEKKFQSLPVRWIAASNLHITLIPPWQEKNVSKIIELLSNEKIDLDPFAIGFKKVSFGPILNEPRLIWAEGTTPTALIMLKEKIQKIMQIKEKPKVFRIHLTLARFNQKKFDSFPVKKLEESVSWKGKIEAFHIIESKQLRAGADYQLLKSIKMRNIKLVV